MYVYEENQQSFLWLVMQLLWSSELDTAFANSSASNLSQCLHT